MDQDDNEDTPAAYEPDSADMDLLRLLGPFSSMITTDKDELIRQLQTIGANMNQATATFFLEMSNWNLQAAVGYYFDTLGHAGMPSMKFLNDGTVGKGEKITPNTEFQLKFLVQNNGDMAWISGTYMCLKTPADTQAQATSALNKKFYVPSIATNESVLVTVQTVSPGLEGQYVTHWAMYTPNGFEFGETIVVGIEVCNTGTMAITQARTGGFIGPVEYGGTIDDDNPTAGGGSDNRIADGANVGEDGRVEDGGTIEDVDMWD
ncbi:protein ILRUN [Anopheles aquasalis]|uniref:protein ILRUN n=1 Tax=Anopheles aquasalis TaxID=42839 RepID=UPI00215B186E|nr:protein ILRUN [Anopheles aquasalis]XP_050084168.1 protein ILRUN [Anopheles aquasalis]